jgi:hypothetical protein
LICDWCERDHTGFKPSNEAYNTKALLEVAAMEGYCHITIGKDNRICHCGRLLELLIIDIPGPAHPATPILCHKRPGCIGPWAHNKELMEYYGLKPLSLPCSDPFCNEVWKEITVAKY